MIRLGISLGDPAGVGAEVTAKALRALLPHPAWTDVNFVVFGSHRLLEPWSGAGGVGTFDGRVSFVCPAAEAAVTTWKTGSGEAGRFALAMLEAGGRAALGGGVDALVTAPVNKQAIIESGVPFIGQTEYLAGLAGGVEVSMMLLGQDPAGRWLRVALVTTHIPLRSVPGEITVPAVVRAIRNASTACEDLGLDRRRVAVCGLNPHAGEGGHMGREEIDVITPAVEQARREGCVVDGPLSGDTVFYTAFSGGYEAVVAMYHDQGLAPLKLIGFERGINWTLGLPFTRTSPDHGTAYDIAGLGVANPGSMVAAMELALALVRRRVHHDRRR